MQDQPTPCEILAAVVAFLRDTIVPETGPHTGYQARVAANALALVMRQIEFGVPAEAREAARLAVIVGADGTLAERNARLAEGIASGAIDPSDAAVAAHLWATTLDKLAVDQPNYAGYRAALQPTIPAKDA